MLSLWLSQNLVFSKQNTDIITYTLLQLLHTICYLHLTICLIWYLIILSVIPMAGTNKFVYIILSSSYFFLPRQKAVQFTRCKVIPALPQTSQFLSGWCDTGSVGPRSSYLNRWI